MSPVSLGLRTCTQVLIENWLLSFDRYTESNVGVSKQNIDPQSEKS